MLHLIYLAVTFIKCNRQLVHREYIGIYKAEGQGSEVRCSYSVRVKERPVFTGHSRGNHISTITRHVKNKENSPFTLSDTIIISEIYI